MKKSFAQLLNSEKERQAKKVEKKLPAWKGYNIQIPTSLALEQCSSSQTAEYKAETVLDSEGLTICDITGGLGSDSFAFSKMAKKVYYFEQNPELVEAVRSNAKTLGISNIEFSCEEITPLSELPVCDIIYADPARRSASGNKVFLLEDCSPDVLTLLPMFFKKCDTVMLKLSPMADITMLASRIGRHLSEVHIVSLEGEVKELLCILKKDFCNLVLKVVELGEGDFSYYIEEEQRASCVYASEIRIGQILLEPSAAVMKAGCFKLLCQKFSVSKLEQNTHIYISDNLIDSPLFKKFRILDIYCFKDSKKIKTIYPKAEVSAKNIFMSSEELRKRLGVSPGGNIHIFGCKTPFGNQIIITESIFY